MVEPLWWLTKDGDLDCLDMYLQHYSHRDYADGRARELFVGPGEKWVFRTLRADAVWVWRVFIDDCIDQRTGERQQGINCAVFRNESPHRSSDLIRQADAIADALWPDRRHYTYVDPEEVASTNPGYCFLRAGWRRAGYTKGGLLVLERTDATRTLELLEEVSEFLDTYVDVRDGEDGPRPNKAMSLKAEVDQEIDRLKRSTDIGER